MTKKLLALLMLVLFVAPAAWAIDEGDGTITKPYKIRTTTDLDSLRIKVVENYLKKRRIYAELDNDIKCGAKPFYPIGTAASPFLGQFDGKGHSIIGIVMNSSSDNCGLFGYVSGAIIKDFTLSGNMALSGNNVGTVVGTATGNTQIVDVKSSATLFGGSGMKHIGGIVGQLATAESDQPAVRGCTFSGELRVGSSTDSNGGIVGYCFKNAGVTITKCRFSGSISSSSTSATIGGILGYADDDVSNFKAITYCFSSGTVNTSGGMVGAIVGYPRGNVCNVVKYCTYYVSDSSKKFTQCLGNGKETKDDESNKAVTFSANANAHGTADFEFIDPTSNANTLVKFTATPDTGCKFSGWLGTGITDNPFTTAVTSSGNFMANIIPNQHTITIKRNYDYRCEVSCTLDGKAFALSTEKSGSNTIYKGIFDYGSKPVFTVTPATHCEFSKWSYNNSTDNPLTYTVTGDATLTANCYKKTYTVQLATDGNGSVSGSAPSSVQQWTSATSGYGDAYNNVTLVATPASGYRFGHWTDDLGNTYTADPASGSTYTCTTDSKGVNTMALKITRNVTFTAHFKSLKCKLTLDDTTGGTLSSTPDASEGTYDYLTEFSLTATPDEGYDFVKWSDGVTTATRSYTLKDDCKLSATFALKKYTIESDVNDSEMGTVTAGKGTYTHGDDITLTATPNEGFCFQRWTDGTRGYAGVQNADGSNTLTVKATADATYTAVFGTGIPKVVYNETTKTMTWYYDNKTHEGEGTVYSLPDYTEKTSVDPVWREKINPEKVVFDASMADYRPTSCYRWFYKMTALKSIEGMEYLNTSEVKNMRSMFNSCSGLTSLDVSGFNTSEVTNMSHMFYHCSGFTSLDVSGFNTSMVTDMDYMFYNCSGLTSLDVSGFNTSEVTDMDYMFYNCSGLIAIYASNSFVVKEGCTTSSMFSACGKLIGGNGTTYNLKYVSGTYARIDGKDGKPGYFTLSFMPELDYAVKASAESDKYDVTFNFQTSDKDLTIKEGDNVVGTIPAGKTTYTLKSVANGSHTYQFTDGTYNRALVVKTFPDVKVVYNGAANTMTWYYDMKGHGSEGAVYNLPDYTETTNVDPVWNGKINPKKVVFDATMADYRPTSCYRWFNKMTSLKSIEGLRYLNTSEVTNMSYMFCICRDLTSLDVSGFNTSKVTDMNKMFGSCSDLTSLDVSGFNTSEVTKMGHMFNGCFDLNTIYASNSFVVKKGCNTSSMFNSCGKLKGGNGTTYSSEHDGGAYACIDGKDGKPGYFTYGACMGDADDDGRVSIADLTYIIRDLGKKYTDGSRHADDLNKDGIINLDDVEMLKQKIMKCGR